MIAAAGGAMPCGAMHAAPESVEASRTPPAVMGVGLPVCARLGFAVSYSGFSSRIYERAVEN